ncbi:MAG: bifunctional diaminohydroxyphosphoribosylaminopyrimidine deaminase/5-amino-6-(5-phosphoribosylamino)uracil reductase RibD [Rhizobiaceae bacterium]
MVARARDDERFMAAAIRLSRRHAGLTGTNPSVATLIVDGGGAIIGRGVTALGGRPHAETAALAEAGARARGATAYVTLEPCAHHGRTPPCAEALVAAGVARVVGAAADPDPRVSGRGYAILRSAGVEVVENVLAEIAADAMADYLIRSVSKRPEVILKLAVSADGMIGRKGEGQVAITGPAARARAHLMRAGVHAILVGSGTAGADDPELTCRLPGLQGRSPIRIVVGNAASLRPDAKLVATAGQVSTWLAPGARPVDAGLAATLAGAGVRLLATEHDDGRVALPELMEDLAAKGVMSVLVEGGAGIARSFMADGLVDRVVLFTAPMQIGADGIASPLTRATMPDGFELAREEVLGEDRCLEWVRLGRP